MLKVFVELKGIGWERKENLLNYKLCFEPNFQKEKI